MTPNIAGISQGSQTDRARVPMRRSSRETSFLVSGGN